MLIFIYLDLALFPEAREPLAYACPQLLECYVHVRGGNKKGVFLKGV